MYAIIQLNGKQYKVAKGDKLKVDRLETEPGKTMKVTDVLLLNDGKTTKIGQPLVEKASVTLKVLEAKRDQKIEVRTYRAKSRYRRNKGHKQPISVIEVTEIKA